MFNSILLHGNIYFRHWDSGQQGVTQVGIYLIGPAIGDYLQDLQTVAAACCRLLPCTPLCIGFR